MDCEAEILFKTFSLKAPTPKRQVSLKEPLSRTCILFYKQLLILVCISLTY